MSRPVLTQSQKALAIRCVRVAEKLVRSWGKRTSYLSADELHSIANETLLDTVLTFDPRRGVPVEQVAFRKIYLELKRHVLKEHKLRQWQRLVPSLDRIETTTDPGDIWNDATSDAEQHLRNFFDEAFAESLHEVIGSNSIAPTEEDVIDHLDWKKRRDTLRAAIKSLGKEAEVIRHRYLDGKTWPQVAEILSVSPATVHRQHQVALQRLRTEVLSMFDGAP